MIPVKYSGCGSGRARGGVHPLKCKECNKPIKVVRGRKAIDGVTGNTFGQTYATCKSCQRK